ncbi:MAG: ABC transporter permease [Elusimicrobia bacterium]|nr:ABC transporter permease [Elusimicrobiota bacterium]
MSTGLKIREETRRRRGFLLGAASVALIIGAWWGLTWGTQVETRVLNPQILPNPWEVLLSFQGLYRDRDLMTSIAYSLLRTTVGFLIAAAVAVPLGVLMAAFTKVREFLKPLTTISGFIPIAALVPLSLSWFGLEERQKFLFLALATFVMLLPLVVASLDRVDEVYLQTAYTLGAGPWQTISEVLVPVAVSDIYDDLCLTYGIGWGYIILAELIDAKFGLGHLILVSQRRGMNEDVYAVLIVIVAISFLINWTLRSVGGWLFPYREAGAGR